MGAAVLRGRLAADALERADEVALVVEAALLSYFGVDVRERAVVDERRIRVAAAGLHDEVRLVGAGLVIDLLPAILHVCGVRSRMSILHAAIIVVGEVVVEGGVGRVGRGRPARRGYRRKARARGEVVFVDGRETGRREGGLACADRRRDQP